MRINTPMPSRPRRRVQPIQRYSPSGSAMSPQTLTSISEARLEQSTSLLSADVSARSADASFSTPRSDVTEMSEEEPTMGSRVENEEPSAHMTDSSVGSGTSETSSTVYEQLAQSPVAYVSGQVCVPLCCGMRIFNIIIVYLVLYVSIFLD